MAEYGQKPTYARVLAGRDALTEFAGTVVGLNKVTPLGEQLRRMRAWQHEDDTGGIDLSPEARDQLNEAVIELSGYIFHHRYDLPPSQQ